MVSALSNSSSAWILAAAHNDGKAASIDGLIELVAAESTRTENRE